MQWPHAIVNDENRGRWADSPTTHTQNNARPVRINLPTYYIYIYNTIFYFLSRGMYYFFRATFHCIIHTTKNRGDSLRPGQLQVFLNITSFRHDRQAVESLILAAPSIRMCKNNTIFGAHARRS